MILLMHGFNLLWPFVLCNAFENDKVLPLDSIVYFIFSYNVAVDNRY